VLGHARTATGSYLGTPLYSAPEQISGQHPSAATDIYSLGCVLYQCLVGRPPFEADTPMGVMAHHLHAAPQSLRAQRPDIPTQLEAAVLRALEKDPERRYASADEMDRSLSAAAASTPGAEAVSTVTTPGPPVIGGEGQPPTRRRWWPVVAAVAGGVAIVAAGISVPVALSAGGRGPASTPSKAADTAFDRCLLGQWTVQSATLPITIGSQTILVSGGRGTRTVFSPNGTEADDFDQSAPFEGNVNGPPLVVSVRGNALTRMTAQNGTITVLAGSTSTVVATGAFLGQQARIQQPPTAPGTTFSYSCASNSLSSTRGGAQVLYAR
jgi:serine/threonine protein kinase